MNISSVPPQIGWPPNVHGPHIICTYICRYVSFAHACTPMWVLCEISSFHWRRACVGVVAVGNGMFSGCPQWLWNCYNISVLIHQRLIFYYHIDTNKYTYIHTLIFIYVCRYVFAIVPLYVLLVLHFVFVIFFQNSFCPV